MRLVRVTAKRQNRGVLEEQELIGNLLRHPSVDELMLKRPRLAIVDTAEPLNLEGVERRVLTPGFIAFEQRGSRLHARHDSSRDSPGSRA